MQLGLHDIIFIMRNRIHVSETFQHEYYRKVNISTALFLQITHVAACKGKCLLMQINWKGYVYMLS